MLILCDANPFPETVNDEGVGGGMDQWGYGGSHTWTLPAGGTLGFGYGGNYLGEVLEGRALGTVVED